MKAWKSLLLWIAFWLASCLCGTAQSGYEASGAEPPAIPPPPTGIQDNADFFRRQPQLATKLSEELRTLRENHGFQIYLVVESLLVTGDVFRKASELQGTWLPDGNGMVVVFEVDTKALGFGRGYDESHGFTHEAVPSYETIEILTQASTQLKRGDPPEVYIDTLITQLTKGYGEYFKRKAAPVPEGRGLRLAMIIFGGVSALALIGLLIAWFLHRTDHISGRTSYYFPPVDMEERLGAPYGGGEVSSRRFGTGVGG